MAGSPLLFVNYPASVVQQKVFSLQRKSQCRKRAWCGSGKNEPQTHAAVRSQRFYKFAFFA